RSLIDAQVEEYLRRGFSSLSIAFGCTGGQHRSAYFAERTAAHLRHEFPQVNVALHHREEDLWPKDTGEGTADAAPQPDAAERSRRRAPLRTTPEELIEGSGRH